MPNMVGLDLLDMVWCAPGLTLALWAQWRMQQTCRQWKAVAPMRRITGAQAAAEVLRCAGITGVAIEPGQGLLTDHYDAHHKVLRLRPHVYYGQSLLALGLAAHEAGHALQQATGLPAPGTPQWPATFRKPRKLCVLVPSPGRRHARGRAAALESTSAPVGDGSLLGDSLVPALASAS
jgi:hypothetical protein